MKRISLLDIRSTEGASMTRSLPLAVLFSASLAVSGCASATWQNPIVFPTHTPPSQVSIVLKQSSKEPNHEVAAQAMLDALVSELRDRGITATVVQTPPTTPPVAELDLLFWDPGSRPARFFARLFGAGVGTTIVQVNVATVHSPNAIRGEIKGLVEGGFFGGANENSAEAVGKAIARAIATGKTD
jgi:hypothetical protein